eukprot:985004-Prymnesium_polylepis.1
MSVRSSGRRCKCAQVCSSAGGRTFTAVFLDLLAQPVEDGRRLRVDALQNGVLHVDQRRLRGDEEAAKTGVARAGGSTPVLNEPSGCGRPRPF